MKFFNVFKKLLESGKEQESSGSKRPLTAYPNASPTGVPTAEVGKRSANKNPFATVDQSRHKNSRVLRVKHLTTPTPANRATEPRMNTPNNAGYGGRVSAAPRLQQQREKMPKTSSGPVRVGSARQSDGLTKDDLKKDGCLHKTGSIKMKVHKVQRQEPVEEQWPESDQKMLKKKMLSAQISKDIHHGPSQLRLMMRRRSSTIKEAVSKKVAFIRQNSTMQGQTTTVGPFALRR